MATVINAATRLRADASDAATNAVMRIEQLCQDLHDDIQNGRDVSRNFTNIINIAKTGATIKVTPKAEKTDNINSVRQFKAAAAKLGIKFDKFDLYQPKSDKQEDLISDMEQILSNDGFKTKKGESEYVVYYKKGELTIRINFRDSGNRGRSTMGIYTR